MRKIFFIQIFYLIFHYFINASNGEEDLLPCPNDSYRKLDSCVLCKNDCQIIYNQNDVKTLKKCEKFCPGLTTSANVQSLSTSKDNYRFLGFTVLTSLTTSASVQSFSTSKDNYRFFGFTVLTTVVVIIGLILCVLVVIIVLCGAQPGTTQTKAGDQPGTTAGSLSNENAAGDPPDTNDKPFLGQNETKDPNEDILLNRNDTQNSNKSLSESNQYITPIAEDNNIQADITEDITEDIPTDNQLNLNNGNGEDIQMISKNGACQ